MPAKRKRSLKGIVASRSAAKLLSALQHPQVHAISAPVPAVAADSANIPELFSNPVHWNSVEDDPAPPILAIRKRQRTGNLRASDGSAAATSNLPVLTASFVSRLHQREVDAPMLKDKIKQQKRDSRARRREQDGNAVRAAESTLKRAHRLKEKHPHDNDARASLPHYFPRDRYFDNFENPLSAMATLAAMSMRVG